MGAWTKVEAKEEEGGAVYGRQNSARGLCARGLDGVLVVLGPRGGVGGRAAAGRRQQVK